MGDHTPFDGEFQWRGLSRSVLDRDAVGGHKSLGNIAVLQCVNGGLVGKGKGFPVQRSGQTHDGQLRVGHRPVDHVQGGRHDGDVLFAVQVVHHLAGGGTGVEVNDVIVLHHLGGVHANEGLRVRVDTQTYAEGRRYGIDLRADAAIYLTNVRAGNNILHIPPNRIHTLKATKIYHEPLMKTENVEFLWDSEIVTLLHNEKLTGIRTRNVKTGEESTLACDGVFVSIGRKPSTELVKDQITIDPAGYIIADESTCTNIPGVFAVGDVRTKALRQVVTAVADGATAVHYAEEYLAGGM